MASSSLSSSFQAEKETAEGVWTNRLGLLLPDLQQGAQFCLPIFTGNSLGELLFTDEKGGVIKYCEDSRYKAPDHRLLWLNHETKGLLNETFTPCCVRICAYLACTALHELGSFERPASDILPLSEFFVPTDGVLSLWNADTRRCTADIVPVSSLSFDGAPRGNALVFTPKLSEHVVLSRQPALGNAFARLILRAHFCDRLDNGCQWIGVVSRLGTCAVGISSETEGYYCISMHFKGHFGDVPDKWCGSSVPRQRGWRRFEMTLEGDNFVFQVDGKHALTLPLPQPKAGVAELVRIGGRGTSGIWAAVEMLHTPTRDLCAGAGEAFAGKAPWTKFSPWTKYEQKAGEWQLDLSTGTVEAYEAPAPPPLTLPEHQAEEDAHKDFDGREEEEEDEEVQEDEQEDGEDEAPLEPVPPAAPVRRNKKKHRLKDAGRPQGLRVECWSVPGESELARMDRVMAAFLLAIHGAGWTLPDNLQRVEVCREPRHPGCFVYSFGTRNIHISLREGQDGRLTVVVRCGGGFFDFVEFVKRHGSVEQLKLERRPESLGAQGNNTTIRLTSVLADRVVRVKENA